jgi:raffinose/stachyose/melibiose transport system permease protein
VSTAGPVTTPQVAGRPRGGGQPRRRGVRGPLGVSGVTPYLYLLPAFLLYVAFSFGPLLYAVWISFFEWDGVTVGTWVGLDNYVELVVDERLRGSFVNALILVGFYSVLPVAIAVVIAGISSGMRIRGLRTYRALLFAPQVVAMVVIGVIWQWLYAPRGPINALLDAVGLGALTRPWLGDFTFALPALGLVGTWFMLGLAVVLLVAAVQRVPQELYEAASLDGAGPLRQFQVVTIPHIRGEIAVALVLAMLQALRNFDLVYVTTMGGPGRQTAVPAFEVFNQAFRVGRVGAGAAIGVALALLIFALTFLITRIAERGEP